MRRTGGDFERFFVHWIPLILCVIRDVPENLWKILVYEPPLITTFWDRTSGWWWHV